MDTRIEQAMQQFAALIEADLQRIERMKKQDKPKDFDKADHIVIGILPGDGTGPILMREAVRVIEALVPNEIANGKIELRHIEGLTIENRLAKKESLPKEIFDQIKQCDVLLKGPMATPNAGDGGPNLISVNSLLRRGLDLFAAVRPIRIPEKHIDWTFFRENIEGEYIWGNKGITVGDDLAIDFKVLSQVGAMRIAKAAFEYARKNNKKNVTVVTKANIVKLTDGNLIKAVYEVGKDYPEITIQERLVDAMCAKMEDPEFTAGMDVIVLPNLYGDIVTDVAAELQGGLGTASSSNIGSQYAMFEAIHGIGIYLMTHDRGEYADPCSLIRAAGMLLAHIGYGSKKELLDRALDICTITERKLVVTTQKEDASAAQFTSYLIDTIHTLETR